MTDVVTSPPLFENKRGRNGGKHFLIALTNKLVFERKSLCMPFTFFLVLTAKVAAMDNFWIYLPNKESSFAHKPLYQMN